MQHLNLDNPHITPHSGCPFRGIGDDTSTQTLFATEAACCFKGDIQRKVELDHQTYFCLTSAHVMCPIYQGLVEEPAADAHDGSQIKGHVLVGVMVGIVALLCLAAWLALYPPISAAADKMSSEPASTASVTQLAVVGAVDQEVTPATATPVPTATSIIALVLPFATESDVDGHSPQPTTPVKKLAATVTPTPSPVPPTMTSTPTPSPSPTVAVPSETPVSVVINAAASPSEDGVMLTINTAANLRIGPGSNYQIRYVVPTGTSIRAMSRSEDYWFLVELKDGSEGWLALSVVADSLSAELRALPIFPGY